MPLIEFKCEKCSATLEKILSFAEAEVEYIIKCKVCGKEMKRVEYSKTAFQLKGTGWAKDGYAKR